MSLVSNRRNSKCPKINQICCGSGVGACGSGVGACGSDVGACGSVWERLPSCGSALFLHRMSLSCPQNHCYSKDSGIDILSEETLHNHESQVELSTLASFQSMTAYCIGFYHIQFAFGNDFAVIFAIFHPKTMEFW